MIRFVDIQGLFYVNPINKECLLNSEMMLLSFRNSEETINFLLRKILKKRFVFDYLELKRALKVGN
jgi:hypothetical protein